MSGFFWATYVILWIFVVLLTLMVLLLYRQFGLSWMSGQRRLELAGLDVGATAPSLSVEAPGSTAELVLAWDGTGDGARQGWLGLFGQPTCPVCKHLWANEIAALPLAWQTIQFVWVDAEPPASPAPLGWQVGVSADESAHAAMEVPGVPYAYVIGPDSRILAKGLVNTFGDVNALLEQAFGSPQPRHEGGRLQTLNE
jgi:hypothetical protein